MTNVIELAKQAGMAPLSPFLGIRQADEQALIKFATLVRNAALTEALNSYSPDDTAADFLEKLEDLKEPT